MLWGATTAGTSSRHEVRPRTLSGMRGPCATAGRGVGDCSSKHGGCWWWERGWVRPSKHLLSTDHNGPRRTLKCHRLVSQKGIWTTILLQKIPGIFMHTPPRIIRGPAPVQHIVDPHGPSLAVAAPGKCQRASPNRPLIASVGVALVPRAHNNIYIVIYFIIYLPHSSARLTLVEHQI